MFFNDLFKPKTVALIGASKKKGKIGNDLFYNIKNSNVKLIPVNIKGGRIGLTKLYKKVSDYKRKINLAVIVIPAKFVKNVLIECGEIGIKSAIIISAGFSEVNNTKLTNEIKEVCLKYNMEILGPNCLGLINSNNNLNLSFFNGMPKFGKISFASQSGALGVAMLDKAIKERIGIGKFISVGNMINTPFSEIVRYLDEDKDTKVICLYVEGFKKGKQLLKVLKKVTKPIIILKAGRSNSGKKAISSHTGSLSGSFNVAKGIFKQYNIFSVDSLFELFTLGRILEKYPFKVKNNDVCVITNAGGAGVLSSDVCEENGLDIVSLPFDIKAQINQILPKTWSHNNPIDVLGDAKEERYKKVLNIISKKKCFDILLIILTPQSITEPYLTAKAIIDFAKKNKEKLICCSFMGGNRVESSIELLEKNGIINFSEPYDFAKIVGKLVK